jgi:hypothetical protein
MDDFYQDDFFPRKPSKRLTEQDIIDIKRRIRSKEFLNRIAADYDVNPGRISEIKTGKAWPNIKP